MLITTFGIIVSAICLSIPLMYLLSTDITQMKITFAGKQYTIRKGTFAHHIYYAFVVLFGVATLRIITLIICF